MADIIVDVSLPSPITTDVTSPTQALATNISVPGPQGPTGPKGNPTTINSLSAENIIITGANGNIVSNNGISIIYISGNSGYFQSAVNILTTNLENTGSNLYSLLTNFSGNLDANYATDLQLYNTGSTLDNKINSLSGWSASAINLQQTGENLYSLLINFSGNLDANYASDAQLFTTGSTLDTKINSLSGYVDIQDNSILLNLNSTGSILDNKINSLSGYSASIVNLASTGSNLYTLITNFSGNLDTDFASQAELNSLSGYVNSQDTSISNNLTSTGSTLNTKINNISGYINSTSSNIIFTTGNQIKSGRLIIGDTIVDASYPYTLSLQSNTPETWLEILNHSGANQGVFFGIDDNNFEQWNSQAGDILFVTSENPMDGTERLRIKNNGKVGIGTSAPSEKLEVIGNILANNLVYNTGDQTVSGIKTFNLAPIISGNPFITGNLSLYATAVNLALTGSNLYLMLTGFSGNLDATYATDSQLATTGSTLDNKINTLSGYTDSQDTTISNNLRTTGSTLDNKINNLSGYVNTQDTSISNNLTNTGITLNNKINSLSGVSVLTYGDQIVVGTKYFNEDVYIHNLYVTGDEFIANVTNNFVESPYLLLNITGGAIDGGIFFVTGSGFTGINDYGPIIGFDHSNKFKIGVARRSDDLSFLPDIASVQQIEAYSGVANNTFSTITNLALTGSTLNNKINSLSGWSASAANLYTTGSTLDLKINSLSGWSASAINLASTGSTLDSKINSLSGWSASAANLASTGSTLDSKINNLSGVSVLTFGDQNISGIKTFNSGLATRYISAVSGSSLDIIGFSGEVVSQANRAINIQGGHGSTTIPVAGGEINITAGNTFNSSIAGGEIVLKAGNTTSVFQNGGSINLIAGTGAISQAGGVNIYAGANPNYAGTNTIFGNININGSGPSTTTPKTINIYRSGNVGAFPFAFVGVVIDNDKVDVKNGMVLQVSGVNVTPSLYATSANLDSTGSTLNTKINNLSGYINSTSSNIVFTTGNQTISGTKTFIQDTTFGDSAQGDFLVISGNQFTVYGSGNFTSGLFVNGNPVFTGSPNSIVYTTGNQTISGVKTFIGNHNISGNTIISGNLNVSGRIITPQQNKQFVYRPAATGGGNGIATIAYGANCTLTPRYVGTLRADACISMFGVNGASTDTLQAASFWYGTGTAPVYSGNLVNLGGTRIGGLKSFQTTSTAINFAFPLGTSWVAEITGLNTGTQYWFDIGISGSNGRLRVQDVQLYIEEKY